MAGVQGALFVPGSHKVALPRTSNGIGGLLDGLADPGVGGARVRERGARRVAYVARHEGVRSPRRDPRVLRVGSARSADVRSAAGGRADRPVRRFSRAADLVPARDDPFRGVTGRGRALGGGSVEGAQSRPRLRREHERLLLPRLQRDQAAVRLTRVIGPARSPASGPCHSIPSLHGTAIGGSLSRNCPKHPLAGPSTTSRSNFWTASKVHVCESHVMKFLCVPCDSPMKLQTVGPPERGSLSVVYSCPECGYEMAMLTNRVRDAGRPVTRRADWSRDQRSGVGRQRASGAKCPFGAMIPATDGGTRPGEQPARRSPSGGRPPRKPGSRTFPSSSAPWRGPASRNSPGRRGPGSRRADPRRGPRVLWHVGSRSEREHR